MNLVSFAGVFKPVLTHSFKQATPPQPQFSALPNDVLALLDKTKTSTIASDQHLVQSTEEMLTLFVDADAKDISEPKWITVLYERAGMLVSMIEKIPSKAVLDDVINVFKNEARFEYDKDKATHVAVVSALIQKTAELYHPDYTRELS